MRIVLRTLVAGTLLASHGVSALEVGLDLVAETEYTTNVARTDNFEVRDWIIQPRVALVALHDGPSLSVDVAYDYEHRFYWEDIYNDNGSATGTAGIVWRAIPQRLDFIVDHWRSESSIFATGNDTPDNRQQTDNTSAGPLLRFNPRGEDEIQLQYEYIDRNSQRTNSNATSHRTSARYELVTSSTNSLTLEGIAKDVDFDNVTSPDLDYRIGQLTWLHTGVDTRLSLTGGYNETERTLGREDVNGPIFDAVFNWQFRPTTGLEIAASQTIDDQLPQLRTGGFFDDQEFLLNSDLTEVFTGRSARASVTQQLGPRTRLRVSAYYDEEDYEDVLRDTESTAIDGVLTRRLPRQMELSLRMRYVHQDYIDENDQSDTFRSDLDLAWQASRRLRIGIGLGYESRQSDNNLFSQDYDAWIARARITYSAIPTSREMADALSN